MPGKPAWLPTSEKTGLSGMAVGEVNVSKRGGEGACCQWAVRWRHTEGAGRKLGNRAEGGVLPRKLSFTEQPARLFTSITLFSSPVFAVKRVLLSTFKDGKFEAREET